MTATILVIDDEADLQELILRNSAGRSSRMQLAG